MLARAYHHKAQLLELYSRNVLLEKYKFWYSGSYYKYELNIEDSDWNQIQYVSINTDGKIIGFFDATYCRSTFRVTELGVVSFDENMSGDDNVVFACDYITFLMDIKKLPGLRKIKFSCVVGSPSEMMNDKAVRHFDVRLIGVSKQDFLSPFDLKYYDRKYYEILLT